MRPPTSTVGREAVQVKTPTPSTVVARSQCPIDPDRPSNPEALRTPSCGPARYPRAGDPEGMTEQPQRSLQPPAHPAMMRTTPTTTA